MKKLKIILDIIMIIIMILLMNTKITGLQIHEIMGIGIFVIFVIHKLLNIKWIKTIGKNILNKNMNIKSKIQFILDIVLFIFVTANVITGILISKCILTNISFGNIFLITVLHKFFAWWSLILISIHIGFHFKMIVNFFETRFKILKDNFIIKVVLRLIYIVIAISGVITMFKKDVYKNLIPIINDDKNMKEHNRDFEELEQNNEFDEKPNPNRDFEDLEQNNEFDEKPNPSEFNKEDKYKNRPNDGEYHNEGKGNKRKGRNFDSEEENTNKKEDNNNNNVEVETVSDTTSGGTPTLNEYLSKFTCSGCGKRCLLSSPQCGTGRSYQTEKINEYNELYESSETIDIQDNNEELNNNFNSDSKEISRKDNMNDIIKASANGINLIDYFSIMGLLIGGTYYIIEIGDNKKNNK